MDMDWRREMDCQRDKFIGIMRSVDDEGIGSSAQLDTRIERIFHLFSCGETGDRSAANELSRALNRATQTLRDDKSENFNGARRDMDGWHGQAAENFFDYLNQLEDGVNLMEDRIDTLKLILDAHQALVLKMREGVNQLVQHTLDGIAAAKTSGWKVGMEIVKAVFDVASTVAGGIAGGPPGAVLGAVAASMVSGAVGVAVEAGEADSKLGVIVKLVDSGEGMIHLVDVERAKIENALRMLADSMTDDKLPEVRPNRPYIVTAPDFRPGAFGLTDQEQGRHRKPIDTRDLVPEPPRRPDGPYDRTTTPDGKPHDRYAEQGPA